MAVRIIEMEVKTVGGSFVGLMSTPFKAVQTPITPTGTSAKSAAFGSTTNVVRVEADEDVHVNIGADSGSDPAATTSHPKIKAGQFLDFVVTPGHKAAVRTA